MKAFKAYVIEGEAGWGTKIDETLEFPTAEERDAWVKAYNEKYNPDLGKTSRVPDWYMIAKSASDM